LQLSVEILQHPAPPPFFLPTTPLNALTDLKSRKRTSQEKKEEIQLLLQPEAQKFSSVFRLRLVGGAV